MRKRRFKSLREGVLRTLAARGHLVEEEGGSWVHRFEGETRKHGSEWEAIIEACRALSRQEPVQMRIAWN